MQILVGFIGTYNCTKLSTYIHNEYAYVVQMHVQCTSMHSRNTYSHMHTLGYYAYAY